MNGPVTLTFSDRQWRYAGVALFLAAYMVRGSTIPGAWVRLLEAAHANLAPGECEELLLMYNAVARAKLRGLGINSPS